MHSEGLKKIFEIKLGKTMIDFERKAKPSDKVI